MRQRMRDEFAKKSPAERDKLSFVIKHGRGGIVDIEFMVQYLVLAHGAEHPALLTWPDNVRILETAHDCGLLDVEQFRLLTDAYLSLRSALHQFALEHQDSEDTPRPLADFQSAVSRIWDTLFAVPVTP
jgi:glutamate-ammonia-ligase adenylyltransferase